MGEEHRLGHVPFAIKTRNTLAGKPYKFTLGNERVDKNLAQSLKYDNKQANERIDCSDFASEYSSNSPSGRVMEISPKSGKWMNGIEYGKKAEFQYHQYYEKDGMIYDPLFNAKPVKTQEFMKFYEQQNPGNLNLKQVK